MAKLLTSFCQVALPVEMLREGNRGGPALPFHLQCLHRPEERESTPGGNTPRYDIVLPTWSCLGTERLPATKTMY
jgi:hypothetical protein